MSLTARLGRFITVVMTVELGTRIARWRRSKDLTPRQLAEKIGVSAAAVYQWEGTGKSHTYPSIQNLEALVCALGLTMARFYGKLPKERPVRKVCARGATG